MERNKKEKTCQAKGKGKGKEPYSKRKAKEKEKKKRNAVALLPRGEKNARTRRTTFHRKKGSFLKVDESVISVGVELSAGLISKNTWDGVWLASV
jgi:hypothetical protein